MFPFIPKETAADYFWNAKSSKEGNLWRGPRTSAVFRSADSLCQFDSVLLKKMCLYGEIWIVPMFRIPIGQPSPFCFLWDSFQSLSVCFCLQRQFLLAEAEVLACFCICVGSQSTRPAEPFSQSNIPPFIRDTCMQKDVTFLVRLFSSDRGHTERPLPQIKWTQWLGSCSVAWGLFEWTRQHFVRDCCAKQTPKLPDAFGDRRRMHKFCISLWTSSNGCQ